MLDRVNRGQTAEPREVQNPQPLLKLKPRISCISKSLPNLPVPQPDLHTSHRVLSPHGCTSFEQSMRVLRERVDIFVDWTKAFIKYVLWHGNSHPGLFGHYTVSIGLWRLRKGVYSIAIYWFGYMVLCPYKVCALVCLRTPTLSRRYLHGSNPL